MTSTVFELSFNIPIVAAECDTLFYGLSQMASMSRDMTEGTLTLFLEGTLKPLPEKLDEQASE